MKLFFFDFETRSRIDLKKSGSVNYATHPSTEATLLTWAIGQHGHVKAWRKGQPIPEEIKYVAENPHEFLFVAHNIMFDYLIWTQVLSRLIPTLKAPKIENLEDNMANTSYFRVGASLDAASLILKKPFSKDKDGRRIMLKQCKPNTKGEWVTLTEMEWKQFEHYGIIDTKLLRDIYLSIPHLPANERKAWEWTFKRNLRGIRIDVPLVEELNKLVDTAMPKYIAEFEKITNYQCKINSPIACKEYFQQWYPEIEDMQADTLRDLLNDKREVPTHVRRALEIKDLAGSTSIAKLKTAMLQNHSGRLYGNLAYAHAHTRRWAGRGIQVHNFPRFDGKRPDKIDFDLNKDSLVQDIKNKNLQDPIGFCKNMLRRIFIPDTGKYFYCGDWSKIEPTVLFWFTNQGEISKDWYEDMASTIYGIPKEQIGKDSVERQIGKNAALGCGYSMGFVKFKDQVLKQTGLEISENLSRQAVNAYRNKYQNITNFWREIEWAFRKAIYGQSSTLCNGKVYVMPMEKPHKGVRIQTPSGAFLYYHHACEIPERIVKNENGEDVFEKQALAYLSDEDGSPQLKKVYGGLLTEHITSSTARDIILPSLIKLEQAGFEVLNTVHDELWGQGLFGRDKEFEAIMCEVPSWGKGLSISASMSNGWRYLK